jgi:FLVCR family MFS transporter 7
LRYAGTITSLSSESAYALLILGQVRTPLLNISMSLNHSYLDHHMQFLSAISQPIFQVLGPKYSEMWFDLKGRTTATMVIAVGEHPSSMLKS